MVHDSVLTVYWKMSALVEPVVRHMLEQPDCTAPNVLVATSKACTVKHGAALPWLYLPRNQPNL